MIKTYFIGGSPCSGKSTITEILAKKYDFFYFKVDDFLDKYIDMGASEGCRVCTKIQSMSPEETWMRDPAMQCEEELAWYREVFDYVCEEINQIQNVSGIIAKFSTVISKSFSVSPTNPAIISLPKKGKSLSFILYCLRFSLLGIATSKVGSYFSLPVDFFPKWVEAILFVSFIFKNSYVLNKDILSQTKIHKTIIQNLLRK